MAEGIRISLDERPGGRGWIVAPTYPLSRETWWEFFAICPEELIAAISKSERRVEFVNGSILEWRSADDEASMRGAGLDWCIVDEAARVKEESWEALRPALSDRLGRAILISTPKGRNWFYRIFQRGLNGSSEYQSWQRASRDNPYFPPQEWEAAKLDLPEIVFQQEYEAEFIDDVGLVFRNVKACSFEIGRPSKDMPWLFQPRLDGHSYILGVDLARTQDWTVICVLDAQEKRVVAWDRFNKIDWPVQKDRIAGMARGYRAPIMIDATGIGDPIYQDLQAMGIKVMPYKFTAESKRNLVNNLAIVLEQKGIRYPAIQELINELLAFEYTPLPSGHMRFGAPSGQHDDCVIALALAVYASQWGLPGQREYMTLPLVAPVQIGAGEF